MIGAANMAMYSNTYFNKAVNACSALAILGISVVPNTAIAHGAWLGNGQFQLSQETIDQLQANADAGVGGFKNEDIIEYTIGFPVIVDGTLTGPGGYITLYKPPGTEVVGAWITDSTGVAIPAGKAMAANGEGTSRGWGPLGQKTFNVGGNGWTPESTADCSSAGFTAANCNAGLAYTYGDTGIFYSTRADTALFANGNTVATLANGYLINPSNTKPWLTVGGTGTARSHNKWDAVQVNAFGTLAVVPANGFTALEEFKIGAATPGRGATPFNSGSPVAGPDSGSQWDRYGTKGPWNRISYPGSCFANDPAIAGLEGPANGAGSVVPQAAGAAINSVEVCTVTTVGHALSDTAPLPAATNALRFSFGGLLAGETKYAKIRVRVTDKASLGVANWEGHGGDSAQGVKASNDNPWRYWVGAVGSVSLASARLVISKSIVSVNGTPYNGTTVPPGANIRYRVTYANAYAAAQTNVVVSDILPAQTIGTSNFTVVSGPNIVPAALPTGGTFNFLTIPSLAHGAGGSIEFDVATNGVLDDTITNVARVNSVQVSTLVTDSVATTVAAAPPPPAILATNDTITGINGVTGGSDVVNAFTADTINGAAATPTNAVLSVAAGSTVPVGLTFDTTTGDVAVAAGTAAGTYGFDYTICAIADPSNCLNATVSVTVDPSVDLSITKSNGVSSVAPGTTVTYTVVATNNGPDTVSGAVVTDVPGAGISCPSTNSVAITGSGVPSGSFTVADLTGSGITLGTLLNGQSATLTYSCQVN